MRAAAIVLSYGREELCELLACWARQTVAVPLLLWLDGPAPELGELPPNVRVHQADREASPDRIGRIRASAVALARQHFELGPDDVYIALDDDDYYHPRHAELTLTALRNAPWTGARRIGLQRLRGTTPTLLESGPGGPGQHPTWAMRLALYDEAGGYNDARVEDIDLGQRIGFKQCLAHTWCTHVRRQFGTGMAEDYNRDAARSRAKLASSIRPTWNGELIALEAWCTRNLVSW
jgi:hypothetical protein